VITLSIRLDDMFWFWFHVDMVFSDNTLGTRKRLESVVLVFIEPL
jgi:hypothetical protein